MSKIQRTSIARLFSAPLAIGLFLSVTGCGGGSSGGGGGGGGGLPAGVTASPAAGAVAVPTTTDLTATFATAADPATVTASTFVLRDPGSTAVPGTVSYDVASRTATFRPSSALLSGTTYTATITTGVKDLAGTALFPADVVWTFTTAADTTAPSVTLNVPATSATGVATNTRVLATFSESMNGSTITTTTILLRETVSNTAVAGTVVYSEVGKTATLTPTAALLANLGYTATVTTGATDLAGRNLAAAHVWTFTTGATTDQTLPTVTSTNPNDLANNVDLNKSVNATFSESMDPATITNLTYTLRGPGTTAVSGTLSYDPLSRIATIVPTANFATNTTYTATITTAVRDAAGNQLQSDKVWTFTTGSQSQPQNGQLPVNLRSAGPFAVLAGSAITSTGQTVINGDVGLAPGSSVGGFPPGVINGTLHVSDPTASAAKLDLTTAYTDAQGRSTNPISMPQNLGGLTLTPGLYVRATEVLLSGTGPQGVLTLDAQGDANAVWVFQCKSSFATSSGTSVVLSGGAQAKNIFWAIGSTAILGTTSTFYGTILAETAVNMKTGATLNGRALAQSAEVTFEGNTVTRP